MAGRRKGSKNRSKFINVRVEDILSVFNPEAVIRIDAAYASVIAEGEPTNLTELTPEVLDKLVTPKRKEEHVAIRKLEFTK